MLELSIGELKKFSPTSSIALEYVYDARKLPHFPGRCTKETCKPSYHESAAGEYWPIFAKFGSGRQPLLFPDAAQVWALRLMEAMRCRPRRCSYAMLTLERDPSCCSISKLPCAE